MVYLSHSEQAKRLILQLQEQSNNGLPLHSQADKLAQTGQLRAALRLCRSSMEIASRQNDDDYMFGAARFHMAMAYFCAGEPDEWNRAAELCEQAAHHFESKGAVREQGIAMLARAYILEALCDLKKDRWQQAFHSCVVGYTLFRSPGLPEHLAQEALGLYGGLGRKYVEYGLVEEVAATSVGATGAAAKSHGADTYGKAPPGTADRAKSNGHDPAAHGYGSSNGNGSDLAHATHSSNGTEPKADSFGENPAAGPTPFIKGKKSEYALLTETFGKWRVSVATCIGLILLMLLFVAPRGIGKIFAEDPGLGILMVTAGVISFGFSVFVCSILLLASQLVIWLQAKQSVVILEQGRVWTIEGLGMHWFFPFRQDVAAIVPQIPKPVHKFIPDIPAQQDRVLMVNISADYFISAPEQFWENVLAPLPRSRVWDIPRPLSGHAVQAALETRADTILQSARDVITKELAKQRGLAREETLNLQVREYLQVQALKDGIALEHISCHITTSFDAGTA